MQLPQEFFWEVSKSGLKQVKTTSDPSSGSLIGGLKKPADFQITHKILRVDYGILRVDYGKLRVEKLRIDYGYITLRLPVFFQKKPTNIYQKRVFRKNLVIPQMTIIESIDTYWGLSSSILISILLASRKPKQVTTFWVKGFGRLQESLNPFPL